jgi:hypothetical protein
VREVTRYSINQEGICALCYPAHFPTEGTRAELDAALAQRLQLPREVCAALHTEFGDIYVCRKCLNGALSLCFQVGEEQHTAGGYALRGPTLSGFYYLRNHEIEPKRRTPNRRRVDGSPVFYVEVDQKPLKNARGALRTYKTREDAVRAAETAILAGLYD